jgi:hypothetical protein
MHPNPLDEYCDSEIELPIVFDEDGEGVEDTVIYTCKGRKNHQGLHHDWLADSEEKDGVLIMWPVEEDIDEDIVPDELA